MQGDAAALQLPDITFQADHTCAHPLCSSMPDAHVSGQGRAQPQADITGDGFVCHRSPMSWRRLTRSWPRLKRPWKTCCAAGSPRRLSSDREPCQQVGRPVLLLSYPMPLGFPAAMPRLSLCQCACATRSCRRTGMSGGGAPSGALRISRHCGNMSRRCARGEVAQRLDFSMHSRWPATARSEKTCVAGCALTLERSRRFMQCRSFRNALGN